MDLTKIEKPFGLLDAETQEELRAHGGPYERFDGYEWVSCGINDSWMATVYRVKPAPPKPREWFLVQNSTQRFAFESAADARDCAIKTTGFAEVIHVREVL
jgi:hypothetical protein